MKTLIMLLLLAVAFVVVKRAMAGQSVSAAEADERVRAATAVLIDVSEPDEWTGGVAGPALLCSLSDLRGSRVQWKAVLEANKDKELILYCASGRRSVAAASILRKEGFNAVNAGGFGQWSRAGLPARKP